MSEHGRAWRVFEFLGLVTDEPKSKVGSRLWWLNTLLIGVCILLGITLLRLARPVSALPSSASSRDE